jgi:hypothetical protein
MPVYSAAGLAPPFVAMVAPVCAATGSALGRRTREESWWKAGFR